MVEVEVTWELGHMHQVIATRDGYTTCGLTIPAESWPAWQTASAADSLQESGAASGSSQHSGIDPHPTWQ